MKVLPIRRGHIEVQPLSDLVGPHGCICGGYARYCLSPDPHTRHPSDVDIFPFSDCYDDLRKRLESQLEVSKENDIAITYERPSLVGWEHVPAAQLIKPKEDFDWRTPEKIVSAFDFSVCRAALLPWLASGIADDDFEEDETKKSLRVKHIVCAFSTLTRAFRYTSKGYRLSYASLIPLLQAVEEQDTGRMYELIQSEDLSEDEINELEALLAFD